MFWSRRTTQWKLRRASRGEIGTLRIGFLGSATASFLPGLIRLYRQRYPGVKLVLDELTPLQQDEAFARGGLDLGFTRPTVPGAGSAVQHALALQGTFAGSDARSLRSKGEKCGAEDLRR